MEQYLYQQLSTGSSITGFILNMWIKIPSILSDFSLIDSHKQPLFPLPSFHIFTNIDKENGA